MPCPTPHQYVALFFQRIVRNWLHCIVCHVDVRKAEETAAVPALKVADLSKHDASMEVTNLRFYINSNKIKSKVRLWDKSRDWETAEETHKVAGVAAGKVERLAVRRRHAELLHQSICASAGATVD